MASKIPTSRVSVVEEPENLTNVNPIKFHYAGKSSQSKIIASNLKVNVQVIACDENVDTVFTNIGMAANCHLDYSDTFDSDSNTSVVSALETVHVDVHNSCM